jgi:pimeloyl-ACP methyl ester carboxylesterase
VAAPHFVTSTDGVRVAVHDLGGPGAPDAPILLFSHATGFHARVWEPMASSLSTQFRCVGIDYRGHGLSELPSDVGLEWSGMADDAEAVLESIGSSVPMYGIGHSMGGAALVLAAARRPDTFRSLWLYEPVLMPPDRWPTLPSGSNPMSEAARRRRDRFESVDDALANYASKPPLNQLTADALRAYVDGGFARQPDGSIVLRCRPETEAAVFEQASSSGAWGVLDQLLLPVAIVAGRPDGVGPVEFAPDAAGALPRGTLIRRPHLGHFGPLEEPGEMAQDLAAWIKGHP